MDSLESVSLILKNEDSAVDGIFDGGFGDSGVVGKHQQHGLNHHHHHNNNNNRCQDGIQDNGMECNHHHNHHHHQEQQNQDQIGELKKGLEMWQASQLGVIERVEEIISREGPLASVGPLGSNPNDSIPPLHWAALNGHEEIVRLLLQMDQECNFYSVNTVAGIQESTALHWACSKGHLKCCEILTSYGATLEIKDKSGYTPLHIAAQHGHTYIVMFLLSLDSNMCLIDQQDSQGRTPLLWAVFRGHSELTWSLLLEGANRDHIDASGSSILHWSILNDDHTITEMLLSDKRCLTNVQDSKGQSPWVWAQKKKHLSWYERLLLESGRRDPMMKKGLFRRNSWRVSKETGRLIMGPLSGVGMPLLVWATMCNGQSRFWIGIPVLSLLYFGLWKRVIIRNVIPKGLTAMECGAMGYAQLTVFVVALLLQFSVFIPEDPGMFAGFSLKSVANISFMLLFIPMMAVMITLMSGNPGYLTTPKEVEERSKTIVDLVKNGQMNRRKYCLSCRIVKPIRSKHCRICNRCVAKFDHHCPWTMNCIGVGNHRSFLFYVYGVTAIGISTIMMSFEYLKSISVTTGILDVLRAGWNDAPFVLWFAIEKGIFCLWISLLLLTQTWQISQNKTTNEMSNMHRLEYFYMAVDNGDSEDVNDHDGNANNSTECGSGHGAGGADSGCDHSHGHNHSHGGGGGRDSKRWVLWNPFDKGAIGNFGEFCVGNNDSLYYDLREISEMEQNTKSKQKKKKGKKNKKPVMQEVVF